MWVSVVVWDIIWLLLGAWGSVRTVHWSVGSGADLFSAVYTIWSVISVAFWKCTGGLNNDWVPLDKFLCLLVIVVWLSLHDDVLTEVLITVMPVAKNW